jgi:glycosyltransferase involved in cell wall biosynthesis
MKIVFFARKMPDLCGAFLHDIDLAIELQRRGHQVAFMTIHAGVEGYNGGVYRGFRYMHYTAGMVPLESSELWICPHSPILPDVRKINSRGFNRPLVATCHFDGNYTAVSGLADRSSAAEMLFFINGIMEKNYRANISPWPRTIRRTEVIRPILHRDAIEIREPFAGDCITLVNANQNKGVHVFLDLARRMPGRKFLGVLPYYGERQIPPAPSNVEWVPFADDIRSVLKRTRILLFSSYYESFGRIAVEAMLNGIPVLYSKPLDKSIYPGGSTEGLDEWIRPVGIPCERERPESWMDAIATLDDTEVYASTSVASKEHINAMDLFSEASRIAQMVESFARENPVVIRSPTTEAKQQGQTSATPRVQEPIHSTGFSLASGRLRILR